ncbi:hypothetical protein GWI33_011324 [Rhynchophorus ferrugineus]|uniref:Uncharacterized protein n=1 Tax=Rhynchophorus ferrugineus TaxID=354439 RepID=A0A834IBS8_RHYFE|nr:hypothetical protein GWI33_011324 [Rhynchophorus ferrugineus]
MKTTTRKLYLVPDSQKPTNNVDLISFKSNIKTKTPADNIEIVLSVPSRKDVGLGGGGDGGGSSNETGETLKDATTVPGGDWIGGREFVYLSPLALSVGRRRTI